MILKLSIDTKREICDQNKSRSFLCNWWYQIFEQLMEDFPNEEPKVSNIHIDKKNVKMNC